MKNINEISILFDYYEKLLTDKQRQYFKDYYFNDLSLSEISENYNISRTAISKQINEVEKKLYYYENNLKLYKKRCEIFNILQDTNIDKKIIDDIMNII